MYFSIVVLHTTKRFSHIVCIRENEIFPLSQDTTLFQTVVLHSSRRKKIFLQEIFYGEKPLLFFFQKKPQHIQGKIKFTHTTTNGGRKCVGNKKIKYIFWSFFFLSNLILFSHTNINSCSSCSKAHRKNSFFNTFPRRRRWQMMGIFFLFFLVENDYNELSLQQRRLWKVLLWGIPVEM